MVESLKLICCEHLKLNYGIHTYKFYDTFILIQNKIIVTINSA